MMIKVHRNDRRRAAAARHCCLWHSPLPQTTTPPLPYPLKLAIHWPTTQWLHDVGDQAAASELGSGKGNYSPGSLPFKSQRFRCVHMELHQHYIATYNVEYVFSVVLSPRGTRLIFIVKKLFLVYILETSVLHPFGEYVSCLSVLASI